MIDLTTGLPGSGKTLWTLQHVEKLRRDSGREVYYFNIPLDRDKLPWIELDEQQVLQWFDLPTGAIIVIDECQRIFRPRPVGSLVPEHEAKLETHRHQGHDLFLITQHPSLVSVGVRRLVENHRHLMRVFGTKLVNVNLWKGVKDQCDKSRADAIVTRFKYPKEVFTWYKSAELHTSKVKIPFRVIFFLALPFIMAGIAWSAYARFQDKQKKLESPAPTLVNVQPGQAFFSEKSGKPEQLTARQKHGDEQMREYYAAEQPRIAGMPWTAPKYDGVTQPSIAPIFEGCIIFKQEAWCYLQGGVKRKVTMDFAQNFIANQRPFIDFQSSPERGQLGVSAGATKPLIAHDS